MSVQDPSSQVAAEIQRLQQVEQALRSSRDQLSILLHEIADGITAQTPDGRLIYANRTAAQVIGFSSVEELVGTPIAQVLDRFEILDENGQPFPPERLPGRQAILTQQKVTQILRFRNKHNGQERWSLVKATPVLNTKGEVELAVNIFQDITQLKRNELAQRILAEAGALLSNSLDYPTTLANVAELAVPELADWCSVHILEGDQQIKEIAVAHSDPHKLELLREVQAKYPPRWKTPSILSHVLQTGQSAFYPEISDEMLAQTAQDQHHLEILRQLGFHSAILLPLVTRGRTLGVLTLVWSGLGSRYTESDLALADELAKRAALALDNARLYQDAQQNNLELERRVSNRTNQLQTLISKLRSEITERKRAEDALRQSETLLQSIFESAPDATVLVDEQGRIVRVNKQTEVMFRIERDQLLGRPIDLLLPERFKSIHAEFRRSFKEKPQMRPMGTGMDLFAVRKDGSEFPVNIMLSPVHNLQDSLVIAAIRDMSEQKRMQSELSEVQQRLIDGLEAERLHLAQELHDGPIQDLYGLAYQLSSLSTSESQGTQEQADELVLARETVSKVVETLREVCGELRPPALAPFGLEKAIRSHMEPIITTHPEIEWQLTLSEDGQALPEKIRLVLFRVYQHAISNVLRHSRATKVVVRFTWIESGYAVLEVQDNGCGFQVPPRWLEMAREGHLGLVGTTERVTAVGGRAEILSSPGNGTTIRVVVPFQPTPVSANSNSG